MLKLARALLPVCWLAGLAPAAQAATEACETRVNDSVDKLLECIRQETLWKRLEEFQAIADSNVGPDGHGNRDTGTPGYQASVDQVAHLMRRAGYRVRRQTYRYTTDVIDGLPRFGTAERDYALGREWYVARQSAAGMLMAPLQAAAGTGTGCQAGEFAAFVPGRVALLERGACPYDIQVAQAKAVGAAAVVVFNSAGEAPIEAPGAAGGEAFELRLKQPATLPVIGAVSRETGIAWRERCAQGQAPVVHIEVRTRQQSGEDTNLIAESRYGDPNHTVIVEGHLDSIYGAGMLDNASGSATILEIGRMLAHTPTRNRLRYIWFGGEELGLLGSKYYTRNLTDAQRRRIAFDIDADVTATPNFDYLIADPAKAPNVKHFPKNVVPESRVGRQYYEDYFASVGVPVRSAWFGNQGTDSNSFSLVGIPNTGILTQQDCCKKAWEVEIWGGFLGNYEGTVPGHDGGCVDRPKRWCDNLANNDPAVLELASRATAYVVFKLANHDFASIR